MNATTEYHPDVCLFLPCLGVVKIRAGVFVAQLGMLFWTVALEFRCRWL